MSSSKAIKTSLFVHKPCFSFLCVCDFGTLIRIVPFLQKKHSSCYGLFVLFFVTNNFVVSGDVYCFLAFSVLVGESISTFWLHTIGSISFRIFEIIAIHLRPFVLPLVAYFLMESSTLQRELRDYRIVRM